MLLIQVFQFVFDLIFVFIFFFMFLQSCFSEMMYWLLSKLSFIYIKKFYSIHLLLTTQILEYFFYLNLLDIDLYYFQLLSKQLFVGFLIC